MGTYQPHDAIRARAGRSEPVPYKEASVDDQAISVECRTRTSPASPVLRLRAGRVQLPADMRTRQPDRASRARTGRRESIEQEEIAVDA